VLWIGSESDPKSQLPYFNNGEYPDVRVSVFQKNKKQKTPLFKYGSWNFG